LDVDFSKLDVMPPWLRPGRPMLLLEHKSDSDKLGILTTSTDKWSRVQVLNNVRWLLTRWCPTVTSPASDDDDSIVIVRNASNLENVEAMDSRKPINTLSKLFVYHKQQLKEHMPESTMKSNRPQNKRGVMPKKIQECKLSNSPSAVSVYLIQFPDLTTERQRHGAKEAYATGLTQYISATPASDVLAQSDITQTSVSLVMQRDNVQTKHVLKMTDDERITLYGIFAHCGPTVHVVGANIGYVNMQTHESIAKRCIAASGIFFNTIADLCVMKGATWMAKKNRAVTDNPVNLVDTHEATWCEQGKIELTALVAGYTFQLLLDHRTVKGDTSSLCKCTMNCTGRCGCIKKTKQCGLDCVCKGKCMNGVARKESTLTTKLDKKMCLLRDVAQRKHNWQHVADVYNSQSIGDTTTLRSQRTELLTVGRSARCN
jgi:hypothetical protein